MNRFVCIIIATLSSALLVFAEHTTTNDEYVNVGMYDNGGYLHGNDEYTNNCSVAVPVQTPKNNFGTNSEYNNFSGNIVFGDGILDFPPSPITNIIAVFTNGSVVIQWTKPADSSLPIVGYEIYRGEPYLVMSNENVIGTNFLASLITTISNSNVIVFTDTNIQLNKWYGYYVIAIDTDNEKSISYDKAYCTTYSGLQSLSSFTTTPGNELVSVAWGAPIGGTSPYRYTLLSSTNTNNGYTQIAQISGIFNFTHTGLVNNTTYYYKIEVKDYLNKAVAAYSSACPMSSYTNPPNPPRIDTVSRVSDGVVQIVYSPSIRGDFPVAGYVVYRSTSDMDETHAVVLGTNIDTAFSFSDTSFIDGNSYYYGVRAFDSKTNFSGYAVYGPYSTLRKPSQPIIASPKAGEIGNDYVMLQWTSSKAGSYPVAGYNVYKGENRSGDYNATPLNTDLSGVTTLLSSTNFAANNLIVGKRYYFNIRAYDTRTNDVWAKEEISVIPPYVAPFAPTDLSCEESNRTLIVHFTPSRMGSFNIRKYKVFLGETAESISDIPAVTLSRPFPTDISGKVIVSVPCGQNLKQYYIRVSAVDEANDNTTLGYDFESGYSEIVSGVPFVAPSTPFNIITKASINYIHIKWDALQEPLSDAYPIAGYKIYRKEGDSGTYHLLSSINHKDFYDTSVVKGISYYYRISTVDALGHESILSTELEVSLPQTFTYLYDPVIGGASCEVRLQAVGVKGFPVGTENIPPVQILYISGNGSIDGASSTWKVIDENGSIVFRVTAGLPSGNNLVRLTSTELGIVKDIVITAGQPSIYAWIDKNYTWVKSTAHGDASVFAEAWYAGKTWDIPLSYHADYGVMSGNKYTPSFPMNTIDTVHVSSPWSSEGATVTIKVITLPDAIPDDKGEAVANCYSCLEEMGIQVNSANPVNTYTGNLLHKVTDISMSSLGFPIYLERTYNSLSPKISAFGYGWSYNYTEALIPMANGEGMFFSRGDGSMIPFILTNGNYVSMFGSTDKLFINSEGKFQLDLKQRMTYLFDTNGNRIKIIDKNKNETFFAYDLSNRVTNVYDENKKGIQFTYNAIGCIATAKDALGQIYSYNYDSETNLISVIAPDYLAMYSYGSNHALTFRSDAKEEMKLKYRRYRYDNYNRVVKELDGDDNTYTFSYGNEQFESGTTNKLLVTIMTDEMGKELRHAYTPNGIIRYKTDTAGKSEFYEYENGVNVSKYIDKNGNTNRFVYNSNYQNTKKVDALGNVSSYAYDENCACNAVIAFTNSRNDVTKYEYDDNQNLVKTIYPDGKIEQFYYNIRGMLERSLDRNGNVTVFNYDSSGNVTNIRYPMPQYLTYVPSINYTYDTLGRKTSVKDMNGNITRYFYNGLNLVTNVLYPDGASTAIEYDTLGRVTKIIDEEGYSKAFVYNLQDMLVQAIDELNNNTFYNYSANNLLISKIDARGSSNLLGYDEAYRLSYIRNAVGNVKRMGSDAYGNVIASTNERGFISKMDYNPNNRLISIVDALTNTIHFNYDELSRMTNTIDADGHVSSMEYDAMGRIIKTVDKIGNEQSMLYDGNGNILQNTDKNGNTTSYGYDCLNRLIVITNALGGVTRFEYDGNGNRVKIVDASLNETRFVYDNRNRLVTIIDAKGNRIQHEYDKRGMMVARTDKRNNKTTFSYDGARRLVAITDADMNSISYQFDEVANLVRIVDKNGNASKRDYDAANRLITITDALSNISRFVYDEANNITASYDKGGIATRMSYDALNRQVKVSYTNGAYKQFGYDAKGNLVQSVDEAQYITRFEYNPLGSIVKVIDALTNTSEFEYDANQNVVSAVDKRGNRTEYMYDDLNRVVSTKNAISNAQRFAYDDLSRITNIIDFDGKSMQMQYDELSRLVSVINKDGSSKTREYDANNNIIRTADELGKVTSYGFDALNRIIAVTNSIGATARIYYDPNGNSVAVRDANGNITKKEYDPLNRLTKEIDMLTNVMAYQYNSIGQVTNVIDKNGYSTRYEYNDMHQLVAVLGEQNRKTTYGYDIRGLRTNVIDANGNGTGFEFDVLGRMTKSIDALTNITSYIYDNNNNLVELKNALGNSVKYEYDPLNRVVKEIDAKMNNTSYSYDALSRVTSKLKPEGERFNYNYDIVGRLTNETQYRANGDKFQNVTYSYSTRGELTMIKDAYVEMGYDYDDAGRMISEYTKIGNVHKSMSHVYDLNNNKIKDIDYENRTNIYTYNTLNILVEAKAQSLNNDFLTTKYTHDAMGMRTGMTLPNNVKTTYAYDKLYNLTNLSYFQNDGNVIDDFVYGYDKVGNKLSKENRDGVENYSFDKLYRITNVNYANGEYERFAYDAVGNRTKLVDEEGTTVYNYDIGNRLLNKIKTLTNSIVERTDYTYNNNGDMVSKIENATNLTRFNRLPDGRIESIALPSANVPTNTFKYSSLLHRVVKVDSSGTNIYLYDGDNAVYVYDEQFRVKKHIVHGMRVDTPIVAEVVTAIGVKRYYHLADGMGNVNYLVNEKQEVVQVYKYMVFGERKITGKDIDVYTFTSREYDADSGLYYYRSRHYLPELARFDRNDDKRNGLNWYVYTGNNPVNYIDPYGYEEGSGGGSGTDGTSTQVGTDGKPIDMSNPEVGQKYVDPFTGKVLEWTPTSGWRDADNPQTKAEVDLYNAGMNAGVGSSDTAQKAIADAIEAAFGANLSPDKINAIMGACVDKHRENMNNTLWNIGENSTRSNLEGNVNAVTGAYRNIFSNIQTGVTLGAGRVGSSDISSGLNRNIINGMLAQGQYLAGTSFVLKGIMNSVDIPKEAYADIFGLFGFDRETSYKTYDDTIMSTMSALSVMKLGSAVSQAATQARAWLGGLLRGSVTANDAINQKYLIQLEKQLGRDGIKSIQNSLLGQEKALAEHLEKLPNIQYKSQVERTIQTIQKNINTLKIFMREHNIPIR